jgi:protein ImuA
MQCGRYKNIATERVLLRNTVVLYSIDAMTALLDWDDEYEAEPPRQRPLARAALSPGELPPAVQAAVWRGDQLGTPTTKVVLTGFPNLDKELPGGGWPAHALTELLQPQPSVMEWRLLGPAIRDVVSQGKDVIVISPPKHPHLPGLRQQGVDERHLVWIQAETPAERLWVTEQLVKANAAGLLIAWLPQARQEQIRRLQVCAHSCDSPVFLCRPATAEHEPSAASLRLQVRHAPDWELHVHLLKRKGGTHNGLIKLPSVPASLASLITPRLLKPSTLLAARQKRALDASLPHVLGRPSSRPPALRVPTP